MARFLAPRKFFFRYKLAGVFLDKVREHWTDMIMGGGISGVALLIVTSFFGLSLAFVGFRRGILLWYICDVAR